MDLPRLVSLLESRTLWLARADLLDDDHEGALAYANDTFAEIVYKDLPSDFHRQRRLIGELRPRMAFLNCWHMGAFESMAMWKIYGGRGTGLAVETSFQHLQASIVNSMDVFGGVVRYADYESLLITEGNLLAPFSYKRAAFQFENEFRLVAMNFDSPITVDGLITSPDGIAVSVDLETLIQGIVVAPGFPEWELRVLRAVLERFGCEVQVSESSLNRKPTR